MLFRSKMRSGIWFETDRYIFFTYSLGRNTPNNRRNELVKFYYSYFDKNKQQLYHLNEGSDAPENEFIVENLITNGLPFLLSRVTIDTNRLYVSFSKKRLEEIIKHKGFSSLPHEQQNRLKTFQQELDDNEVIIMILQ